MPSSNLASPLRPLGLSLRPIICRPQQCLSVVLTGCSRSYTSNKKAASKHPEGDDFNYHLQTLIRSTIWLRYPKTSTTPIYAGLVGAAKLPEDPDAPIFYSNRRKPNGYLATRFKANVRLPTSEGLELKFPTVENFVMRQKFRYFKPDAPHRILAGLKTKTSKDIEKLCRLLEDYDEEEWKLAEYDIMKQGTIYKFIQNEELGRWLLATENRELVFCSKTERMRGIGFPEEEAEANRSEWGENRDGKLLMEVRRMMRKEHEWRIAVNTSRDTYTPPLRTRRVGSPDPRNTKQNATSPKFTLRRAN